MPYKIKFELAHPYVKNLQIDGRDVDVWEHASPKVMVGSKASWTIGLSGGQHEIRIVTGDYE